MTCLQYALIVLLVGTSWTFEPIPAIGLLASLLLYSWGMHRLRLHNRVWPKARSAPFFSGLIVIGLATLSPLAADDTRIFSVHVIQHLMLAMVAPALLCLGAPITLWLQATDRKTQLRSLAVLHSRPVRMITFPIVAWMLFVTTLFVLYFSPIYPLSMRNPFVHDLVHIHFLASGFLFFAPIVAIDPHPHRMPHGARLLYMGLTLPVHAFLALALLSAATPIAVDWYLLHSGHTFAQIATDQKVGASIMWVSGDLLSILTVAIVVSQWVRDDERTAAREDRHVETQRAQALIAHDEQQPTDQKDPVLK